jgi:ATP-dependent Lon protease
MKTPPPAEVLAALAHLAQQPLPEPPALPADLPLLPLRNALLTAGAVAPLSISRPSTIAAVHAARPNDWIAVFSQRAEDIDSPTLEDLHPVGCAAKIVKALPHEQGLWLVVRAVNWITLDAITQTTPYIRVRASRFDVSPETNDEVTRIELALRQRARTLAASSPNAEKLIALLEGLPALQLADAVVANLPVSVDDKAAYANESSLLARLERALKLAE